MAVSDMSNKMRSFFTATSLRLLPVETGGHTLLRGERVRVPAESARRRSWSRFLGCSVPTFSSTPPSTVTQSEVENGNEKIPPVRLVRFDVHLQRIRLEACGCYAGVSHISETVGREQKGHERRNTQPQMDGVLDE